MELCEYYNILINSSRWENLDGLFKISKKV